MAACSPSPLSLTPTLVLWCNVPVCVCARAWVLFERPIESSVSEENKLKPYEERKEYTHFFCVDPLDGTKVRYTPTPPNHHNIFECVGLAFLGPDRFKVFLGLPHNVVI